jgi:hypothetical protein
MERLRGKRIFERREMTMFAGNCNQFESLDEPAAERLAALWVYR